MRRSAFLGVLAALLLAASPASAREAPNLGAAFAALDRAANFAGVAYGVTNAGQILVTVDSTVHGARLARVRSAVQSVSGTLTIARGTFRPLITGGDAIYGSKYRCSLGFNVTKGATAYFLTAGHCGKAEKKWWTSANHSTFLGNTTGSSFPGNDYAIVQYTASYTDHPSSVGNQNITSAGDAYVGETVKRTGSTTGTHSGEVTALNVTVRYQGGGVVRGLIQTTVCAEPGDSGGPLYDGAVALGLTSGGSGDCRKGGTTFFQPIGPALSAYGVSIP